MCLNIHDLILGTWRGGPRQWVGWLRWWSWRRRTPGRRCSGPLPPPRRVDRGRESAYTLLGTGGEKDDRHKVLLWYIAHWLTPLSSVLSDARMKEYICFNQCLKWKEISASTLSFTCWPVSAIACDLFLFIHYFFKHKLSLSLSYTVSVIISCVWGYASSIVGL